MTSELVRRVMNNISQKNLDSLPGNGNKESKDSYEYQKKIALSNYGSGEALNHRNIDRSIKQSMDLNSLADEIRGNKSDKPSGPSKEFKMDSGSKNKLTLQDLSRMAGGKADERGNQSSLKDSGMQKETKKRGLTLDKLADNMKKNI
nr:hypothetical protein [Tissierella sp.]